MTLCSTNVLAEKCSGFGKSFTLNPDVGFGNKYFKSLSINFKKYGVCIVEKSQGYPTRLGNQSLRFEVKPGDCGYNKIWSDCKTDRERHELRGENHNDGEYWYVWSIYLPKNFINVYPTKLAMGQFHQDKGHVVWMFQNSSGGYHIDNQVNGYTQYEMEILESKDMIGKWNDIIINTKPSLASNHPIFSTLASFFANHYTLSNVLLFIIGLLMAMGWNNALSERGVVKNASIIPSY